MNDVSIIIPVYNGLKFLPGLLSRLKCIEANEILFVDNGSSDGSYEFLLANHREIDNSHVLLERKPGVVAARSRGLSEASGEFVVLLDQDDLICEDFIRDMSLYLQKENQQVVFCDGNIISQDGSKISRLASYKPKLRRLLAENYLVPSRIMWRRSILEELCLFSNENTGGADDWEAVLKVLLAGIEIGHFRRTLMEYRQHTDGAHNDLRRMKYAESSVILTLTPLLTAAQRKFVLTCHHLRFAQYYSLTEDLTSALQHLFSTNLVMVVLSLGIHPRLSYRAVRDMVRLLIRKITRRRRW